MSDLDMLPKTLNDDRWTAWINKHQTDPLIDPVRMRELRYKLMTGGDRHRITMPWGTIEAVLGWSSEIAWNVVWSEPVTVLEDSDSDNSFRKILRPLIPVSFFATVVLLYFFFSAWFWLYPFISLLAATAVPFVFREITYDVPFNRADDSRRREADNPLMTPTVIRLLNLTSDPNLKDPAHETLNRLVTTPRDDTSSESSGPEDDSGDHDSVIGSFWNSVNRLVTTMSGIAMRSRDTPFADETRQALSTALELVGTTVPVMDEARDKLDVLERRLEVWNKKAEKDRQLERSIRGEITMTPDKERMKDIEARNVLEHILDPELDIAGLPEVPADEAVHR